jgi:putative heme iron utilization protein
MLDHEQNEQARQIAKNGYTEHDTEAPTVSTVPYGVLRCPTVLSRSMHTDGAG